MSHAGSISAYIDIRDVDTRDKWCRAAKLSLFSFYIIHSSRLSFLFDCVRRVLEEQYSIAKRSLDVLVLREKKTGRESFCEGTKGLIKSRTKSPERIKNND